MSVIKFNEVRGFSDSITTTFNFVRQEFLPLLKSFCVLSVPVIFIDLFIKSVFMRDIVTFFNDSQSIIGMGGAGVLISVMGNYLSTMIVFYCIQLQVISYLRVYWDKSRADVCEQVTVTEVWRVMRKNAGIFLVWGFLYLLIVSVGTVFFIVPGIYLAFALAFTSFCIIFEDTSLGRAVSGSRKIVRGRWWYLFAYIIVLQFIVGVMTYAFSIPTMVIYFKSAFTEEVPGVYELTFGFLLSDLGRYLMQIIAVVGAGVMFFSIREQQTHSSLLDQINQMGIKGNDRRSEEDIQNEQED